MLCYVCYNMFGYVPSFSVNALQDFKILVWFLLCFVMLCYIMFCYVPSFSVIHYKISMLWFDISPWKYINILVWFFSIKIYYQYCHQEIVKSLKCHGDVTSNIILLTDIIIINYHLSLWKVHKVSFIYWAIFHFHFEKL